MSSPNQKADTVDLKLPVSRVTLFEDRAEVVRLGRCPSPGHARIVVRDVSPLTAAERTKVTAKRASDQTPILVDDVRVEHRWVDETTVDEDKAENLRAQYVAKQAEVKAATEEVGIANRARAMAIESFRQWQERTGWVAYSAEVDVDQWRSGAHALEAAVRGAEERVAAYSKRHQALMLELRDIGALTNESVDQRKRLCADIVLRLSRATEDVDLEISTQMPCALWRPTHEAHLIPGAPTSTSEGASNSSAFDENAQTDPGVSELVPSIDFASVESDALSVEWRVQAAVWQHTGEEWNDVELLLSTERPSKGAQLPSFNEDRLTSTVKSPEEKKTIRVEHRTERAAPNASPGTVPGVYDGGEARLMRVPTPISLPSDGRPRQVSVRSFTTSVHVDRVAFPDESARVFRRAKLTNDLDVPLLAGPVSLRESGAFIGIGDLRYVGAREEFAIAFGTDDGIVVRTRRYQSVEARRIAKDKTHYITEVTLLSARAEPAAVDVILRWPVSELEQVKIEPSLHACTGGTPNPDADGLVHLPLTVPASGRKMVQLGFSFDVASGVQMPPPW